VREGTDSKRQRERREALLREVLGGVFDELDPRRTFNAVQRRILWNASRKKRCAYCREEIARWEDVSIDHLKPYIRGGKTNLANGRLAHKTCNARAGARR
jgi:5-methylcytosine-specific restriction endonuclease McrA